MAEVAWPSVDEQLNQDNVPPGSALERLIREHQEFHLLRPGEAADRIGVPPWLRVYWRKQHPELSYPADDPTGGYPRVLRNLHAWMVAHPDLRPEPVHAAAETAPGKPFAVKAGADLRISGVQATPCSESDIRINLGDTNKIISAANAIGGSQAQFFSTDGGAIWTQTTLPLADGDTLHSDPSVGWTTDGTAWATTIGIQGAPAQLRLRAYQSTDWGKTWAFDDTVSGNQIAVDKQLMWVDNSPTSQFKDNIYVIWYNRLPAVVSRPAYVNRRTGPTGAWQAPVQVSGAETTGTAIGGDVTTNSSGDVFAMWPDTGSRSLWVAKSTDGGASFGSPVAIATTFASFNLGVPSFSQQQAHILLSAGAYSTAVKDLVYAVWTDLTGGPGCSSTADAPGNDVSSACKTRIWFSRSTDGGVTWAPATKINDQASLNDQFNPRLAVDHINGSVAVIYYDTVDDPGRLKTDVWYQTSADDGVTWSVAAKVTTAQTDETVASANADQYGDYNGLSGSAGTFFPSWTDRRNGALEEIWTAPIAVAPTPVVTGISPASGAAAGGDTVTITGTGFTGASTVSFGSAVATIQPGGSDAQLTVTAPAANVSGTVDVTVTTPGGTSAITQPADQFTYIEAPVVTGISPASGAAAGGDTVTITGTGFTGATDVSVGPTSAAAMQVDADTQITATSPPGTGTVDVTVTTPGGTSATTPADQFTYM
jgi:IPT/TIG domain